MIVSDKSIKFFRFKSLLFLNWGSDINNLNNFALTELLLSTEDSSLVEGNDWNDKFWGVCQGKGLNHLGRILMKVRKEVKEKETGVVAKPNSLDEFFKQSRQN